ncbi:MAG: hypothetical protein AB7D39_04285 [Pseudodesulfovibrio sp.]|uniref:hypothetical protein n=1 Tax=Pseudodesulfovibrio sp. TaxID=2035812 RepID=UPI003D096BF6
MSQQLESILERLREALPVALPLSDFDRHPALPAAKTIRNMRSARSIPTNLFFRDGTRVLVDRDSFLAWWGQRLREDAYSNRGEAA